ncbi:MAG: hypothetical protein ABL308_05480 [Oceanicaulis sp.]
MTVRTAIAAPILAASAAVLLAACGSDDDAGGGAASRQAATGGLEAFGLTEGGAASWADMSVDGEVYTFTDFTLAEEGARLQAARLVLTGPGETDAGPALDALVMEDGVITFTDGEAAFDRLSVDEPGPDLAAAIAASLSGEEMAESDDLLAQSFARMAIEGLRFEGQEVEGETINFTLASAEAEDFDGEMLGRAAISNFALDASSAEGEPVSLLLDSMSVSGLDMAAARAMTSDDPAAPFSFAASPANQYDQFEMSGLSVAAGGLLAAMPSLEAEIEERGGRFVSTAAMPRMTLSANPDSAQGTEFAGALDQLGYEEMVFSFASETVYDPEADRVTTQGENRLTLEDGFEMRFEQDLSGVTAYAQAYADWFATQDPEAMSPEGPPASVFEPLKIHSMLISLEDQSLIDRSLAMAAEMQGVTPAELRAQASMMTAMMAPMVLGGLPRTVQAEMVTALSGFIGEGGTLIVGLEPETPISASVFMAEDPSQIDVEALGLAVRREPAE